MPPKKKPDELEVVTEESVAESVAEVAVDDSVVTLEFRGVEFTFPKDRDEWPTKAIQAFSRRKYADGVEQVLGSLQWDMLNEIAPKYKEFFEFINVFGDVQDKECTGG